MIEIIHPTPRNIGLSISQTTNPKTAPMNTATTLVVRLNAV